MQGWADGSYANWGIVLQSIGKASSAAYAQCYSSDYATASQRPKLEVHWHQQPQPAERKYYYLGGQRVALRTSSGVYYLLSDHLGSTSLTLDSSGAKYGELRYKPFGETRYTWGSTPTAHKFTGQREESALGLYDYRARFYDPLLGRFISADTIVPDPGNPQSFNRYSYVNNRPLVAVDPTGHDQPFLEPSKGRGTGG